MSATGNFLVITGFIWLLLYAVGSVVFSAGPITDRWFVMAALFLILGGGALVVAGGAR